MLIVSARDIVRAPIFKKDTSLNRGRHVLHMGGRFDSHLLLPRIPAGVPRSLNSAKAN